MYHVIDLRTGACVYKTHNMQRAYGVASKFREDYSYIDGRDFDCVPA